MIHILTSGREIVCSTHQVSSQVPCCPWPDCKNGNPASKIKVAHYTDPDCPYEVKRQVWEADKGDPIYSWPNDGPDTAPYHLTLQQVFEDELKRRHLLPSSEQNLNDGPIYHYTSPQGLIGILSGKSIWQSDFAFMNDTSELKYGCELVLSLTDDLFASDEEDAKQLYVEATKRLTAPASKRYYIASFSTDGDNLSLWRSYGSFSIGMMVYNLGSGNPSVVGLEYEEEKQQEIIRLYTYLWKTAFREDEKLESSVRGDYKERLVGQLSRFIPRFKHPAFEAEREVRLIEQVETKNENAEKKRREKIRFRSDGTFVVPYLEHPLGKGTIRPKIVEVVIGPNNAHRDTLEGGIRELLDHHGFSDVKITQSEAPFR